jgi:hypothetical protein
MRRDSKSLAQVFEVGRRNDEERAGAEAGPLERQRPRRESKATEENKENKRKGKDTAKTRV